MENDTIKRHHISPVKFMAITGLMAAFSIILQFLEFPIFPLFNFLKLDFSSVASLISGFLIGPLSAVIIEAVKCLVILTKTMTAGIGELSNFICAMAFVLPPTIIYRYKRNFKWVAIGLIIGVVCQVIISALSNYFLIFPLYIKLIGMHFLQGMSIEIVVLTVVVPFNLIKTVSTAIIAIILYKHVGKVLKRIVHMS